jgi:hypothetical protein
MDDTAVDIQQDMVLLKGEQMGTGFIKIHRDSCLFPRDTTGRKGAGKNQ